MTDIFKEYAQYYDLIYNDKDYIGETRFVSRLINNYCTEDMSEIKVLDLACGTGKHVFHLNKLGFNTDGSDISTGMINAAKSRVAKDFPNIKLYNESFQTCNNINNKYNVLLAMFASINYLTSYEDLKTSLENVKYLLNSNGIFIFDFWNGNAVLSDYSKTREKIIENDKFLVKRISSTKLDKNLQIATIDFEFSIYTDGKLKRKFKETHHVRYFFPQEISDLFSANGFDIKLKCPFLNENRELKPDDWNVSCVATPQV